MADSSAASLSAHLLRGLQVASAIVVATVFAGLVLPHLLANLDAYRSQWLAAALYLALVAVMVVDGVLVALHRSWGWARWPAATGVLSISVVATADLPPEGLVAPAHQTLGFVSWIGLLLFADYSLPALGLFLAAHYGLTIVQLGLVDRWDVDSIVRLATVAVGVAGFQIAFGLAGVALRRVARQAAEASTRQAKLLTAEAVAEQVHADREARYGQLRGTAVPLLRDIGEGTLDPSESEVQRRCAVEAARMRRLFAEDSDTEDPFTAELAGLSDVAERKGTVVRQSVVGSWLSPPPPVRMILLDEVARVLLAADTARITLSGTGEDVTVSVVADGICRPAEIRRRADVLITTVTEHDRVWVEAQWTKLLSPAS